MTRINTLVLTLSAIPCLALSAAAIAQTDSSAFEGVWSGWLTTQENAAWQVADYICFIGCPGLAYAHLTALLDDPANDARPLDELVAETRAFSIDHLRAHSTPAGIALMNNDSEENAAKAACQPYDFARATTNPLPVQITRKGDTLTFYYEQWERERTIYLDGRGFPDALEASSLGYSIGRFDGDALIIETRGLVASTYPPITINAPGGHSAQLRGIERYTIVPGETPMLMLELTLDDPLTLTQPYVYLKRWIATPGITLPSASCTGAPAVQ